MTSIAFGLSWLGCILLSLSLKRHFRQVWPDSANFAQWLFLNRLAGYSLVSLALVPCVIYRGLWIGLVLWISTLALAAFLQAMLLTWQPQRSLWFAGASCLFLLAGVVT